jgi:FkbM family methyltransferase
MAIRNFFKRFSSNRLVQRLLEINVRISQSLMGIGSGGNITFSGEEVVFRILKNHCLPPYCIFDVGANKGRYVEAIRNAKIDYKQIHCFEPGKSAYSELLQACRNNSRIQLNQFALGSEPGTVQLYYDKPGSNLASLTKRRLQHFHIPFDNQEDVKVDTIDNYCRIHSIDHIHLLKLDVEGHELDVLSGGINTLEKGGIDIISFEFGGCNIDTRTFLQDFYYLFSERLCMKMYRVTPSGYLYAIDEYKEIYEQFRTSVFIVVKKEISGVACRQFSAKSKRQV